VKKYDEPITIDQFIYTSFFALMFPNYMVSNLSSTFISSNVGIVAHGDADGICSSAIVKTKYPGALVLYTTASNLHRTIKEIDRWAKTLDTLFIVDVAINPKTQDFVLDRLSKVKGKFEIYFIDNHLLPWEIESADVEKIDIQNYVDHYLRREHCSSSAMTFATIYGDGHECITQHRVAALLGAYGAISDYAKDCDLLQEIVNIYDETSIYYQAFMLKQASRVIQSNDLKRTIADKLSAGMLPSEIFEVVEAARESSREVDLAIRFIHENAEKMGNLGILLECPVASMGHNAFVTATTTQSPIGVAINRRNGNANFVLRKQHDQKIHLGELATIVAHSLDIDGGGEESTAGITASDTMIVQVLHQLDLFVSQFLRDGKLSS
jgi:RecJ-like exonuclease